MKRIVATILLLLTFTVVFAQTGKSGVPRERITSLINEFRGYDGFEVVRMNSLGTSAIKALVRMSALSDGDKDSRALLDVLKGIKKIAVVDYEDCERNVKDRFSRKIGRALSSADLLMEVKDGTEVLKMYGVVSDDSAVVKDFVMFSQEDCALICLFGSISLDAVMKMSGQQ